MAGWPIQSLKAPLVVLSVAGHFAIPVLNFSFSFSQYDDPHGVKVRYLHSDIDALERVDILRDLRLGAFDVLVGINLLREGLDLPEVNLVAILDADKEGFLRSERSLIQTAGRAARNADSIVVLYADRVTDSMARMMEETERRREIQAAYNQEHGITPTTVTKSIAEVRSGTAIADHKADQDERRAKQAVTYYAGPDQLPKVADPVVAFCETVIETSWARTMLAPWAVARAAAAAEATSRSAGAGPCPAGARNPLRLAPNTMGARRRAAEGRWRRNRSRPARSSQLPACVFAKPRPGSVSTCHCETPAASAAATRAPSSSAASRGRSE